MSHFKLTRENDLDEIKKDKEHEIELTKFKNKLEYFQYVRERFDEVIDSFFKENDRSKKVRTLADLYDILDIYKDYIIDEWKMNFSYICDNLNKVHGKYSDKYVAKKNKYKKSEVEEIVKFGEKNNYPPMVLVRNEDNAIFIVMEGGQEQWDKALNSKDKNSPRDEWFYQLLESVRKNDIDHEELNKKRRKKINI